MFVCLASYSGIYASNELKDLNLDINFNIENLEIEGYYNLAFFDDCAYSVFWTDKEGKKHSKEMMTAGTTGSYTNCVNAVNEKLDVLRSWGYTIDNYSITYGEDGWW